MLLCWQHLDKCEQQGVSKSAIYDTTTHHVSSIPAVGRGLAELMASNLFLAHVLLMIWLQLHKLQQSSFQTSGQGIDFFTGAVC